VKEETLTSYIYSEGGYRASTGPVGPRPFFRGGPYIVPTSENRFMEAGTIRRPPPLIDFTRWANVTASLNKNDRLR
jgi:hypothetical protein